MRSTGDLLRTERERRRQTIQQVAEATKIKGDHIRAIEKDNWGAFAARVYVRGFVKTYARHLRLDEAALALQLEEELAGHEEFADRGGSRSLRRGPLDFIMMKLALLRWQILFPLVLGAAVVLTAWWAWNAWQRRPIAVPATITGNRLHSPRSTASPASLPLPLPSITNAPVRVPGR